MSYYHNNSWIVNAEDNRYDYYYTTLSITKDSSSASDFLLKILMRCYRVIDKDFAYDLRDVIKNSVKDGVTKLDTPFFQRLVNDLYDTHSLNYIVIGNELNDAVKAIKDHYSQEIDNMTKYKELYEIYTGNRIIDEDELNNDGYINPDAVIQNFNSDVTSREYLNGYNTSKKNANIYSNLQEELDKLAKYFNL